MRKCLAICLCRSVVSTQAQFQLKFSVLSRAARVNMIICKHFSQRGLNPTNIYSWFTWFSWRIEGKIYYLFFQVTKLARRLVYNTPMYHIMVSTYYYYVVIHRHVYIAYKTMSNLLVFFFFCMNAKTRFRDIIVIGTFIFTWRFKVVYVIKSLVCQNDYGFTDI